MDERTFNAATAEAKRFLKKAALLKEAIVLSKYAISGGKESAAVKRSSMDLTRALADMRRGR